MDQPHMELPNRRYVAQRSTQLERTTVLRKSVTEALAWSELGYSSIGIAKQMDTSKSTVQAWLEEAMARYGLEIAEALGSHEEPAGPEPVDAEYLFDLRDSEKVKWIKYVDRHAEKYPDEWVDSVISTAKGHVVTHDAPELEAIVEDSD